MNDMDMSFNLKEMDQFQKALNRVGKLPQKVVKKAATAGGKISKASVEAAAPVGKTGQLRKGFKQYPEKSRTKGKSVFRFGMSDSDSKNKIFQKKIPDPKAKHPGERRTTWDHAYYPHSVEYGFLARTSRGGLKYVRDKVEGKHFVRKAAEEVRPQVEKTIRDELIKELEKEWQKK